MGTDAAAYVALLADGRWADAYDVARAPNPFVSICGRICAAPCERACRRGRVDAPIAIRALKRVLTEAHGLEAVGTSRWSRGHGPIPDATGPSVGIIGAGPAGLSAAHDLRLAGHRVTLYEQHTEVGGMLTYGVPSFRLPRGLIETELTAILQLGVELRAGVTVGRDVSMESLLKTHAAVLVSVGCQQGRWLETPGVELDGVIRAVDFLRNLNAPAAGLSTQVEGPVVVIGGGSVAFDAARSAWRLQGSRDDQTMFDAARSALRHDPPAALSVTVVALEDREALAGLSDELASAEQEGVQFRGRLGVLRVVGRHRVEGVEVAPVASLYDEAGRFAPKLDTEQTEVVPARTLVLAVGQQSDTRFLAQVSEVEPASSGTLEVDPFGRTPHPRIYAAGDVTTGPQDLIRAIASGQAAAAAMAHDLSGRDRAHSPDSRRAIEPPPVPTAPPVSEPRRYWSGYDRIPRTRLPLVPPEERSVRQEVEAGLPKDDATREASRCLRCDEHLQLSEVRCIACGLCVDICPYGCLSMESHGSSVQFRFDDSICIRCRLCVDRCPADALGFETLPA